MIAKDLTQYIRPLEKSDPNIEVIREQLLEILAVMNGKIDHDNFADVVVFNRMAVFSLMFLAPNQPMETGRSLFGDILANGTTSSGLGFSSSRIGAGYYSLSWGTAFLTKPSVIAMNMNYPQKMSGDNAFATTTGMRLRSFNHTSGAFEDADFSFIAWGPV